MFKRTRGEDEVVEVYATLLRQSGARAIERIRQRRSSGTNSVMPIDALVIRYAMWFLDTSAFPAVSYVTQAQRVVTEAIERVSYPQHFSFIPLSTLVECLVSENTAEVMQQTVVSIEEFIDARDALGRWIDENIGNAGGERYERYNHYSGGEKDEEAEIALERAGILWRSALYWVAVFEYIEALSLSSAKVNVFALRPRYEQELMNLLNSIAAPKDSVYWKRQQGVNAPTDNLSMLPLSASATTRDGGEIADSSTEGEDTERMQADGGDNTSSRATEPTTATKEADPNEVGSDATDGIGKLLVDLIALVNCPSETPGSGTRINPMFYTMVHARLNVIAACERLNRFGSSARVAPPPLTASLQSLQSQREALNAGRHRRDAHLETSGEIGLPLDFVPSEAYLRAALERENITLEEDEELFKDEIVDYYKRQQQHQHAPPRDRSGPKEPTVLMKPHRFCKVKTGYTWTQYNRTHYDVRSNPPPRSVLWYEFTLFYPALASTKRDMSRIYHIEDTSRGSKDDYCVLVFSVGPPYADVAYQIVRKQWDPRPGGVRASFDSSGTYRLFFRFTNSNYRR
ncbi:hypothetical protein, conserved [Trypanosoma brucei gambiense DAL972]|uniref:Splicing factor Cactin C-terminal domain-containing protein n=2 Tax=Trypanosoma brucei TaxID=5691 RepID=D0A932_TRYB9|nr:hypothetical protein, conserved [Trypanosoma brucei gambiense DAL972]RHW68033.1 Cactus-binding C-terminus of cactin protein [Trypanosoma brucei equiperdum]CBH18183.1 hypothetical protein, conserved [Trypanosoma brucei gambiense DAL972]|eukprot:XP_011780447.1 hypothetical protein, conserved [Trypanosoma brucei gambiense DAL972]